MYVNKPALLTIPFNHEDYADGTVVRMDRTSLAGYVRTAAEKAGIAEPLIRELVRAMYRKSTALVAVGAFQASRIPECKCPANHAGFVEFRPDGDEPRVSVYRVNGFLRNFPFRFDASMFDEYAEVRVIEVIND